MLDMAKLQGLDPDGYMYDVCRNLSRELYLAIVNDQVISWKQDL